MASKINRTPILTGKAAEEFEKRTNESYLNAKHRQYPTSAEEAFSPMPEAMFPITKLREAYYYYENNAKGERSAENFFHWLNTLEKDIPFDQQKYQP